MGKMKLCPSKKKLFQKITPCFATDDLGRNGVLFYLSLPHTRMRVCKIACAQVHTHKLPLLFINFALSCRHQQVLSPTCHKSSHKVDISSP